jgi:hypothetical protein
MPKWNSHLYSGALTQYGYPPDKEYGSFLDFLKQINNPNVKIHLMDQNSWTMTVPQQGYDVYIVCSFGEFVNETVLHQIDSELGHKELILLTSQYYDPTDLKNFKIYTIEHLHTITRFFRPKQYLPLSAREHQHATQSRRNALHKSLVTQRLLARFPDLQYTFCNIDSTEYQIESIRNDLKTILAVTAEPEDIQRIENLHNNPRMIPGDDWDITDLYKHSKLFWTTESIFLTRDSCPTAYLTEKTVKPIVAGSAWMLAGQQGSYQRVRNMGFETFESEFGIDFDSFDDQSRLNSLYTVIDKFDFDAVLAQKQTQEIVDYNYNHFFNNLTAYVETRNQPQIQSFLDYVNQL